MFAGTPEVAVPALEAILASDHELAAVITRPDAAAGRGRRSAPSPVRVVAEEHGVEVLTPSKASDVDFLARLRELAPDCAPVVAYGTLLPLEALAIPTHGWVNLHFSLLPAWRGAAPVQHAVLRGDEITGASVFQIEKGLDTGPVYGTLTEQVRPDDTSGALLERLAGAGAGLLLACLDAIADGSAQAVSQPADGVSLAPKLSTEDARVRWGEPARAVDRRVRACTPAPGAWTTLRGERVKLGPLGFAPETGDRLAPGELRVDRRHVLVGTATDPLVLGQVQAPGKRPMPATDWARGARPEPGESFA